MAEFLIELSDGQRFQVTADNEGMAGELAQKQILADQQHMSAFDQQELEKAHAKGQPDPELKDESFFQGVQENVRLSKIAKGIFDAFKEGVDFVGRQMDDPEAALVPSSRSEAGQRKAIGGALNIATLAGPTSAGGAFRAGLRPTGIREARGAISPGKEAAIASKELGVPVPRGITSDSKLVQQTSEGLGGVSVLGTPIPKAAERAREALTTKALEVTEKLGATSDDIAGGAAKAGIEKAITVVSKNRVEQAFIEAGKLMPAGARFGLGGSKLADIAKEITTLRSEGTLASSKALGLIKGALDAMSTPGGGMSYNGLKTLRTEIGRLVGKDKSGALPSELAGAELKRVYGALTEDMLSAAKAAGPKALKAHQKAQSLAKRQGDINKELNTILSLKNESVVQKVHGMAIDAGKANLQLLRKARGAVDGKTWDEISGTIIQNMGRKGDDFDITTFAAKWQKLTPEGKRILFGSTGNKSSVKTLDNIATLSKAEGKLAKFGDRSGAGRQVGFVAGLAALGLAVASPLSVGLPALVGTAGTAGMAKILSNPASQKSLERYMRARIFASKSAKVSEVKLKQAMKAMDLATRALINSAAKAIGDDPKEVEARFRSISKPFDPNEA